MSSNPSFWPVVGFEDAAVRKRLAFFRPWIEDKKVTLPPDLQPDYVQTLAEATSPEEAEFEWGAADGERWSQAETWPFAIQPDAAGQIVTRTSGLPSFQHARVGIAIPTHSHPKAAVEAAAAVAAEYPGFCRFVIVANGVDDESLEELGESVKQSNGLIQILDAKENLGYGRGCNLGLSELLKDETLAFIGVMNDDVLPGTDCLLEMVRSLEELQKLGHRAGAIGPVSNEINGGQRVDIGKFRDVKELRAKAFQYWTQNRSSAAETIQLRGLFTIWTRECLETVGGFDPRFGIGNFEDDDHNLRVRLAGYSLWIATGAFLFHHGSSTFRSLKVDYEANIRRNAETLMRKWGLSRLEDWISLSKVPDRVELFQAFESEAQTGHTIKINGESVDLIHQASDVEFAAWVMNQPGSRTAEGRKAVLETLARAA